MTRPVVVPVPRRFASTGGTRRLNRHAIRVEGCAEHVLRAASAVCEAAYDRPLASTSTDADVVVEITEVDAPTPVGTPPRAGAAEAAEAYAVRVEDGRLRLSAANEEAAFRGLLTIAGTVDDDALPLAEVDDHPAYAWRGLSLDVARRWFPVEELLHIIDLLALHKLNVLHLHLTDSQAWRFEVAGYPDAASEDGAYSRADLVTIDSYASDRFVTVVPELDVPGHVAASVAEMSGIEVAQGSHPFMRYLRWSDPGVADFVQAGLSTLTECFTGSFLHLGGDEAFGAPHDEYVRFIRETAAAVRNLGRTPIGWQEAVRSGAFSNDGLVQLWIAERDRFDADKAKLTLPAQYHPLLADAAKLFALSVDDPALIGDAGVPTIVSSSDPLYLDRRTSDPSTDPAQTEVWSRLGHPGYDPTPTTAVLHWQPATQGDIAASNLQVAGIEAALWCESVRDFDDVATLLLPRLALVAQRAWSDAVEHDSVIAATAAHAAPWSRLGFGSFYRSAEVFSP